MAKIPSELKTSVLLVQTAEECSELAQACLKFARKLDGTNPTPKGYGELTDSLIEEMADVYLSLSTLQAKMRIDTKKIDCIFMQKLRRWSGRLAENDADEENENA